MGNTMNSEDKYDMIVELSDVLNKRLDEGHDPFEIRKEAIGYILGWNDVEGDSREVMVASLLD